MGFVNFLHKRIADYAWDLCRNKDHLPANLINNTMDKKSKEVFLNIVYEYAVKFGPDDLISHKNEIVHYGKFYKVSPLDTVRHLYICVGESVAKRFERKSTHIRITIIIISLMVLSFIAGHLV